MATNPFGSCYMRRHGKLCDDWLCGPCHKDHREIAKGLTAQEAIRYLVEHHQL